MKVALIGSCPSSRWLAPFNDPSWKIWACGIEDSESGIVTSLPRIDDFFEFHANMLWPENRASDVRFLEWLDRQAFTLWMQDQRFIRRARAFPLDACIDRFGEFFFTSSIPLMMAKAIMDGAKEIALFGVDLATSEERRAARPAVQHFILEADRSGIKVSAPIESDIMRPPPIYGYVEATPMGRKNAARKHEMREHMDGIRKELGELQRNLATLEGAYESEQYYELWTGRTHQPAPVAEKLKAGTGTAGVIPLKATGVSNAHLD